MDPADECSGGGVSREPADGQTVIELARLSRTLKTLNAGHRTLLRASDEQELLHEMCKVIVDTDIYLAAWVFYAEHDEQKSLRLMAKVAPDTAQPETYKFTWADTELGQTAVAIAIRTGEPVVGRNLRTDPVYDSPPYSMMRAGAIDMGYESVTAFPLRMEGHVLGALAIAASDADAFDTEEIQLINGLAEDLAYGIANLRTRVQHQAAEAMIASLAYYDSLTGLPNRTLLHEKLETAIATASQENGELTLLQVQVSRLDEINKILGYQSGDDLLQEVGRRLSENFHGNETLARVGEYEFALLLPNTGIGEATEVAEYLVNILNLPVEVSGLMLDARVSIGIACFPDHGSDVDAIIRCANAAVHAAKPTRSGYVMYTGVQERESARRLSLMSDLHRAFSNDELALYCQPKIDCKTRNVCGVETLVRWQHSLKGMIPPAEFIPLAEQAGMVTPLTNWMLEAAFSQGHAWQEAGLLVPLAINLSALDLYDPMLIDRINSLFSASNILPALIQFELTESALMVDPVDALNTLIRLKRLGVQLFIDDYGTGHSSLSYLQKLPADAIKIDQSFVRPLATSRDAALIVRSTIELSHSLGLKVVAEGVESQAVWERLVAFDCDVAQGYHISMPMPSAEFQEWEAKWLQTWQGRVT
jgi:diguanylate cyclase (GGDEF)-like protein